MTVVRGALWPRADGATRASAVKSENSTSVAAEVRVVGVI